MIAQRVDARSRNVRGGPTPFAWPETKPVGDRFGGGVKAYLKLYAPPSRSSLFTPSR
jgi:hypothetical protein